MPLRFKTEFQAVSRKGRLVTGNRRVVGVIEDDASVRRALHRLFRSEGFDVALFATAEDFFADPCRAEVDCLVIDVCLPGMGGLELLERVRGESLKRAVAIVITSNHDERLRQKATAAGASGFFLKPFDNRQLKVAVAQALGMSKQ